MFRFFIGLTFLVSAWCTSADYEDELVVATYSYNDYNRALALEPLRERISRIQNRNVHVKVFDSPTSLSNAFKAQEVDIAVTNLYAYLNMLDSEKDFIAIAVPDSTNSKYSSSIVAAQTRYKGPHFIKSIQEPVGIVWKDSASGGLIGLSYLMKLTGNLPENIEYGSHQNVVDALIKKEAEIGIVATQVFLEASAKNNRLQELWRSSTIPFGPIICTRTISKVCSELQQWLLNEDTKSEIILDGLKLGWPEFSESNRFILPKKQSYAELYQTKVALEARLLK